MSKDKVYDAITIADGLLKSARGATHADVAC